MGLFYCPCLIFNVMINQSTLKLAIECSLQFIHVNEKLLFFKIPSHYMTQPLCPWNLTVSFAPKPCWIDSIQLAFCSHLMNFWAFKWLKSHNLLLLSLSSSVGSIMSRCSSLCICSKRIWACKNSGLGFHLLDFLVIELFFFSQVPWHVPCGGVCYGDGNLVFIANDWHTALLPVYLKSYYRDNGLMKYTRSVLVIDLHPSTNQTTY